MGGSFVEPRIASVNANQVGKFAGRFTLSHGSDGVTVGAKIEGLTVLLLRYTAPGSDGIHHR